MVHTAEKSTNRGAGTSKPGKPLDLPKFENQVDVFTKGQLSRNFSQKTNGRVCFSILTTQKYLKLEIKIQVSSISELSG